MTDEEEHRPSNEQSNSPTSIPNHIDRYQSKDDGTVVDTLLGRQVTLTPGNNLTEEELLSQATFLSRLQHPGLPCVLDFEKNTHGAHIVMRPISGVTLSEAVISRNSGTSIPAIADAASCAITFIAICDALSAAHNNGIVHGALGPENIVLNDHGEVVIQGWIARPKSHVTTSRFINQPRSNESTPLLVDGLQDDIRDFGRCFYLALSGEPAPRNSKGELDHVSFASKHFIPKSLGDIIRKAMLSTATEGYPSLDIIRGELTDYLSGSAPKSEKPGIFARTAYTLSAHKNGIIAASILIAAVTAALIGPRWNSNHNFATWGFPLVTEDFSTDTWKTAWQSRGQWEQKDGRLISQSGNECALIFRQRLTPPVAIEYTGQFSSLVKPGDLSIWWCEGDALSIPPSANVDDTPAWFIQAGAVENAWCTIWRTPDRIRSQVNNLQLLPDVEYHFRVEIESDRLRMWIDNKLILEHHELFPIGSGNVGLYTWDPGKTFDNVTIWQKQVPELISPLAIGDEAYRSGRYVDASSAYNRVAASHQGKPLGITALYFQGLALHKNGQPTQARKIWEEMPDGNQRHRAESLLIDDFIAEGDIPTAIERFTSMWSKYPNIHDILKQRWQVSGQQLRNNKPINADHINAWIELRNSTFRDDATSRWLVAEMLNTLERWDEVIQNFSDELRAVAPALMSLGRNAEVAHAPWATSLERTNALLGMGKLDEALQSPDANSDTKAGILCKMGRAQEAALIRPFPAAVYLGPIDEALTNNTFGPYANIALLARGRYEEAAGDGVAGSPLSGHDTVALILLGRLDEAGALGADTRFYRMLEFMIAGNIEEALRIRPDVRGNRNGQQPSRWFTGTVGLALIDRSLGISDNLQAVIQSGAQQSGTWGGRMELVCQAALDPSKDAAVLAMPWKTEAHAWLYVAQALRAELAHDEKGALAAWTAYSQLPPIDRLLNGTMPNIQLETLIAWRRAALRQEVTNE